MEKEKGLFKKNINKAVALSYDTKEIAPKVVAKGKGVIADKIVEKGLEEDIVVYKDEELVENLMGLEINEQIPEELYSAVAEIIFYIYNLDKERGKSYGD
ncbi:EscU/YscU/HrcU family type III secretion system export apparatus switch protein [Tissierella praeacuta]|uniref:Flagellar biosynthesis protein n=1 Tax=Tissierella praeacuta DSM 18095 TaxID=1123404 RepID=A0A1M4SMN5_9FIRM|nr:EscU/YscU/HrcU family type III secretion system export apparatus switch protein [Tissierella praeacuta]MBU5254741.1 EscU/YscU/HrcU family type III secretion system export apparatus switch protein [Tissierella praeacuta]TCU70603.1 flagellar biosynthesis protein [Tissierella praeacuta]SHE33480.1 flagellar biosynthesis protein [Tissierella praeacuta DSM 18095]SUP01581.1 Flagellar biosynthetic protein flhB [Tissierella praeacuta]